MVLEEDRDLLSKLYYDCKDYKEKIRYQALYAVSRGFSVSEIAAFVDVEESTIYDWIHKWEEERTVKDKPRSGRPESLTKEDDKEMKDILDKKKKPEEFGINAANWTTVEFCEYFLRFHNKNVDEETIRQHLRELGAHYVKAQLAYVEADEEKQIAFVENFYQQVTSGNFTRIIFFDEMSVKSSARRGYGWTTQERLVIDAPQRKVERANCFIATEILGGKIIPIVSKSAKTPTLLQLFEKIKKIYRGPDEKILLCGDNGKPHVAKETKEFFRKNQKKMVQLFTSTYSPDLNPQEYINGFLREKLFDNSNFGNINGINIALQRFVRRVDKRTVRSVATLIPIEALLSFRI